MQLIVIFLCLFSSPKIASACSSQEGVCCEHARFGATHPTSKKDRRHTHYSLERSTSDRLHTHYSQGSSTSYTLGFKHTLVRNHRTSVAVI